MTIACVPGSERGLRKQFVMCKKGLFFNVLKGNTIGPCLSGIVCVGRERSNQKIVTAWFSGNALFSTEQLFRIS